MFSYCNCHIKDNVAFFVCVQIESAKHIRDGIIFSR